MPSVTSQDLSLVSAGVGGSLDILDLDGLIGESPGLGRSQLSLVMDSETMFWASAVSAFLKMLM